MRRSFIMYSLTVTLAALVLNACGSNTPQPGSRLASDPRAESTFVVEPLGSLSLNAGETRTFDLRRWRNVKRLVVDAVAVGHDALVEIETNGEVKGTLYIPGADPTYVVTIGEAARSIQFRHVRGGRVTLSRIDATLSSTSVPDPNGGGPLGPQGLSLAADLSERVIHLTDEFFPLASTKEWVHTLLPVKIKAGRAYAQASASGDLSGRVRESLVGLMVQMEMAEPYIENGFQKPELFDLCVRFLAEWNKLQELLN